MLSLQVVAVFSEIGLNVAVTERAVSIKSEQVAPVQSPVQPTNVEKSEGVGVSVTSVPKSKTPKQVSPQKIPAGDEVTEPGPVVVTESVRVVRVKVAVTVDADVTVTTHVPLPVHAPDQPANVEPVAGVAISVTTVPLA